MRRVCLQLPYCGLCRFQLHQGETIVTRTEDGLWSSPRCLESFEDAPAEYRDSHPDGGHWGPECHYSEERTIGFHDGCLDFDQRLAVGPLSPGFLRATEYAFEPPASVQRRRQAFFRSHVADNIRSIYGLPLELCYDIAKHLVRECAIVSLRLPPQDLDRSYWVALSSNVYATFIAIEGIRYIKSLSNAKDSGDAELVWSGTSAEPEDMFVAEDYWGLRSLRPARRDHPTPTVVKAGVWWRRISSSSKRIRVGTDGWKIRYLADSELKGPVGPGWLSPQPLEVEGLWLRDLGFIRFKPVPCLERLTALRVNDADIVGYSACLQGFSILTLQAHSKDEPLPPSFYEDAHRPHAVWLYFPVAQDERISEIQIRRLRWGEKSARNHGPGLMLVTNKDRSIVLGPHLNPFFGPVRAWLLLSRLERQHSHLVFNSEYGKVTTMACSDGVLGPANATTLARYPPSQIPLEPPPSWLRHSWGYFTSAPLENVVQVTVCQTGAGDASSIIGMLLEYADGLYNCVGQYRYDGVLRVLDVGDAPMLRIRFSRRPGCFHHVSEISVGVSRGNTGHGLELPWRGRLEWWTGPSQVEIHHGCPESQCNPS